MDELEEMSGDSVNFIPCLKFVSRGVAKPTPDKVKPLTNIHYELRKRTLTNISNLPGEIDSRRISKNH